MRFVLFALDKPDSLELRKATRAEHLDYLSQFSTPVGGPMLDEQGNMCGSMVVFEAESRAEVEDIAANDPYAKAGLFESVTIREFVSSLWPTTEEAS